MHAVRPPSPSPSTPTLPKSSLPPRALPVPLSNDVSPSTVLRQLLLEWYSGVAELLIGEAAAADVCGYRNTPHLRACEVEDPFHGTRSGDARKEGLSEGSCDEMVESASTSSEPDSERGALQHSLHFLVNALSRATCNRRQGGLTDERITQLTERLSSLCPDTPLPLSSSPLGCGVSPPHEQEPQAQPLFSLQNTLKVPCFDEREELSLNTNEPPSLKTSVPTAAPHMSPSMSLAATSECVTASAPTPWWYTLADVVNSMLDGIDGVVDTVFAGHLNTTPTTTSLTAFLSPLPVDDADALASDETTVDNNYRQEDSCIMAGLLLNRNVYVRPGPAFASFTSPLLVVLDLDLTVLRHPLSSVSFRAVQTMLPRELQALYVDADFFCGFCEAVTRRGHELAFCSFTEGASDQHGCGLSVPEVVLFLLSAVLPQTRTYLTSPEDVVCLPKSAAGPGKLYHLQVLQQRHNARGRSPVVAPAVGSRSAYVSAGLEHKEGHSASLSCSSPDVLDGILYQSHPAAPLLLPRWLSTDVLLIDDDKENCRLAVTQGYHAAHCAKTGLSASWFAARSDVQALLGVTADEIPRRRAL
ncbi:hypothetical protein ABL78_1218 [Leptomonas seymouri]|uniref:Uncharacterized protein n=1 Tax=Leptomonas seymouri TaxID=5684 RepID=A0A0N0P8K4_LEPSE|nr:hypothetical protein ABL78_1218 [Leptomonas seymouri]|eukprot:KPI89637.1 hypothetical protein ABL78_1218 [Leptomonas seymouri]